MLETTLHVASVEHGRKKEEPRGERIILIGKLSVRHLERVEGLNIAVAFVLNHEKKQPFNALVGRMPLHAHAHSQALNCDEPSQ